MPVVWGLSSVNLLQMLWILISRTNPNKNKYTIKKWLAIMDMKVSLGPFMACLGLSFGTYRYMPIKKGSLKKSWLFQKKGKKSREVPIWVFLTSTV